MIFTNLAGTTSNSFKVGSNSNGQIVSNNAYDFFWNTPDPISGAQNFNIRTLGQGDDIFALKDVGQYCCTSDYDSNLISNMPKQTGNVAFLLLVEPSIGYNTQYIKYTMRFRNGETWICERIDNTTFIAWERYAWANDIHHETGNWFPTVSSAYTMSNLGNNTFTRWGRFCYLNAYFILTKTVVSGADLSIGGVPFPIFYGQMNGNILIADEYVKSINDSDETITTIVPDFPIPSPASSNTFGIIAQTYTTASSNSASNMILSDFMRLNVNLHIRMSLIYTVVV